jgi:hypothetical protein
MEANVAWARILVDKALEVKGFDFDRVNSSIMSRHPPIYCKLLSQSFICPWLAGERYAKDTDVFPIFQRHL